VTIRLDFSIGPVQGFVTQSRRTCDLWGSSYLLSFLSAHAMHGACRAGGRIVQPVVACDPLYRWIVDENRSAPPHIASVPNHFVLELDGEPSNVARGGIGAFERAWNGVCGAVWERFVAHACEAGEGTEEIWHRQTANFWEIMWTAGDAVSLGGLLARRKHWRSHRLPDESGDKCTVMHDFQELSGYVRTENLISRERQDMFWARIRERVGSLDLREDERLCALALVKRLFAKVAQKALGGNVDTSHWPSTVYVAAVPWIRRATMIAPEKAREYAEAVKRFAPKDVLGEWRSSFFALNQVDGGDFHRLDANYFHRGFVEDERLCPLKDNAPSTPRAELIRLLEDLRSSKDESSGQEVGSAPAYYALLLADGDHLGKLVHRLGSEHVGRALSTFTARVPEIVREHNGVTVYAGGDDVLAMLPVSSALVCASSLAGCYAEAFGDARPGAQGTLSAGVVFAHVRLPLGAVIGEAHRLLDEVAKDANGRDSLAVGVLKRGGLRCEWVTTWTRRSPDIEEPWRATSVLQELAACLKREMTEPGLSSGLIYRIRDTLSLLCGWPRWTPGAWGSLLPDFDVRAFLHAEICRSLADRRTEASGISEDALTDLLMRLLHPSRVSNGTSGVDNTKAGVDAYLLARFLAVSAYEEDEA
jgi:CRISPR-associated protein Cmr2